MFNPLDLFSTVKSAAITVGVIAAATAFGLLWFQKNSAERHADALQLKVSELDQTVFQKTLEVSGLRVVITNLEEVNKIIAENFKAEQEIEKDIENAKPEDDGAIAPVLRGTLDSVDRMLHKPN